MIWTIRQYITADGHRPFGEWLNRLPVQAQARIAEARVAFGPGYRVYFGQHQQRIILLLVGGSKASQQADIRRARQYWRDYVEGSHGTT